MLSFPCWDKAAKMRQSNKKEKDLKTGDLLGLILTQHTGYVASAVFSLFFKRTHVQFSNFVGTLFRFSPCREQSWVCSGEVLIPFQVYSTSGVDPMCSTPWSRVVQ